MKKLLNQISVCELELETLNAMRIFASTEEFGDCLLWTGAISKGGYPIFKPTGKCCTLVRREVYRLSGRYAAAKQPVMTVCGERCCLSPAHLRATTTSKVAQAAADRGAWSSPLRSAKIAASRRGTMKLTQAEADLIRVSVESGPVLAARYGVCRGMVNRIKAGQAWKVYSSPFAGLGARG